MAPDSNNTYSPFVSVIIPAYNASSTIGLTIRSITENSYKNIEIIVVDDGSTESTADIAEKSGAKVIRKSVNTGAADSRNIGVKNSKGEIILFTDADCILSKSAILRLVRSFKDGYDIVSGSYSKVGYKKENICSSYHSLYAYYNYRNTSDILFGTMCAAIRRDFFDKTGGFDSSIKGATVEDLKFQIKLQDIKCRYKLDMKIQVHHNSRSDFYSLIRGYFFRAMYAVELMKKMGKITPQKESYIINYRTAGMYISLLSGAVSLLMLKYSIYTVIIPVTFFIIYLALKKEFFCLIPDKKNFIPFIFLSVCCDMTAVAGGTAGLLRSIFSRQAAK
jgi:glycosyltransferase involved in cell wall biosynthesis